ncbi:MAG: hypothetical protein H6R04_1580 [Burkholderiaceae bacterium]|nr:hypothetical protein [Burkholderiaceae bacterium]
MCFVLDVNCVPTLFDPKSDGHNEFAPLLGWLFDHPNTCLVVGGEKYLKELGFFKKYLSIFAELRRLNKITKICSVAVDFETQRIKAKNKHQDFDDEHLVALLCASGCLVFASKDKRADKFIKMKSLYTKAHTPPKIYRNERHGKKLLCDQNIATLKNTI